jgi:dUTP pyrophosphatase
MNKVVDMRQYEFDVRIFNESENELPSYAKDGDSGMDIRAKEDFSVYPSETKMIETGISVRLPFPGLEIQVRPRSGMSLKTKLRVSNSPGTVDSNYTGPVNVIMDNIGDEPIKFKKGERIAQIVLCPVYKINWVPVDSKEELGETNRGESGFGSTGTK